MLSCTKALREKKFVRFSPKTHESDGLGTDSRGMKGRGAAPEERDILGKFFDPAAGNRRPPQPRAPRSRPSDARAHARCVQPRSAAASLGMTTITISIPWVQGENRYPCCGGCSQASQ
eukprot:825882-Prymnesium_polylepis.1